MKKRMSLMGLSIIVFFALIFGFIAFKNQMIKSYMADFTPPPVTVSAYPARQEVWDRKVPSVGTLYAVKGVEVTTEGSGLIRQIHFKSGQDVKQDQMLVALDDSVEQANLRSYEAQLRLATINYERDKKLLASHAISKTDFDTVQAKLHDVEAQVERTRAIIAQKQIKAPFDGKLGIGQINLGQYLMQGQTVVTLQDLSSLYVDFTLPEKYLPDVYVDQEIRFTVAAYADNAFTGHVTAINAKVDNDTRNLLVRATVKNPQKLLLPGMFANLELILEQKQSLVAVPQTAVTYSLYGNAVYVVKEQVQSSSQQTDNAANEPSGKTPSRGLIVELRYVEVGRSEGRNVAILKGLDVGELVVTAGQIKLANGAAVIIDNSVKL